MSLVLSWTLSLQADAAAIMHDTNAQAVGAEHLGGS